MRPSEPALELDDRAAREDPTPSGNVERAIAAGVYKAGLPVAQLVVRGALSGALLGAATLLALSAWAQGSPRLVGALVFPVGFCLLVLLGLELATGNFALLPASWWVGRVDAPAVLRNWWWVYLGNALGSLGFAVLAVAALTEWWTRDGGPLAEQLRLVATAKTVAYAEAGVRGWATVVTKGVLANCLVTVGSFSAFAARSTVGRILAMWLPIATLFGLGYEHAIVNLFVIPAGMLAGAPVDLVDWWLWNLIPATLGNIAGDMLLTGLALSWVHSAR
ncbi:MAG: formate/nitrite transporter family protein [Thermomicrobium sp.]|nr:formate/nitrite transporter family protein [Thermomicrobium sp.]MDW8060670.1 formate/nitrite transporter family protein [Thermomicrobium sp.]